MLQLTAEALQHRLGRRDCGPAPCPTRRRPSVGCSPAWSAARTHTIAFELAGGDAGAWTDDDGAIGHCGTDFLMRQVSTIGGGTTEMARNVISERVLGMPRERTSTGTSPSGTCPEARVRMACRGDRRSGPGSCHPFLTSMSQPASAPGRPAGAEDKGVRR